MTTEKQILIEMADDVRRIRESYFGQADYLFAKKLYEDGYRKQSVGHWDYIATHDCFSCSICKFDSDVTMRHCGGCGAKMKGGDTE